jgi:hypothetical protein
MKKWALAISLAFSRVAYGATTPPPAGGFSGLDPLGGKGLSDVITSITDNLLLLAAPLIVAMVIVGGIQIMTSAGDPKRLQAGKDTLWYAVMGFVAVLLADSVYLVLKDFFS